MKPINKIVLNVQLTLNIVNGGSKLDGVFWHQWISSCLNCNPRHISVAVKSAEIPTVVVDMDGGLIQSVSANSPVHVIVLDADIEGTTESLFNICGNDVIVSEHNPAQLENEYVLLVKQAISEVTDVTEIEHG
jgi:hypothetical protein